MKGTEKLSSFVPSVDLPSTTSANNVKQDLSTIAGGVTAGDSKITGRKISASNSEEMLNSSASSVETRKCLKSGDIEGYSLKADEASPRRSILTFDEKSLGAFFDKVKVDCGNDPFRTHQYIPYERFILSNTFLQHFGFQMKDEILGVLKDWDRGCVMLQLPEAHATFDKIFAVQTAVAYMLGTPRCDGAGSHYAFMSMSSTSTRSNPLINPENDLPFHTDGTFFNGDTDWLLFSKLKEESGGGGLSNIMHIKDWPDYEKFKADPMSRHAFIFRGPQGADPRRQHLGNRGDTGELSRTMFYTKNSNDSLRVTLQWVHPKNIEEAAYLKGIADSLNDQLPKTQVRLPVGHMYLINNHTWLHGRTKFDDASKLDRQACRMIGEFSK